MVKYKSKIAWILILLIFLLLLAPLYQMLKHSVSVGSLFLLLPPIFIGYIFITTYYEIGNGILRVKSGFLLNRCIQIKDITKIEATYNPISAPATSFDRLEVFYNKYESVIISPKKKQAFIAHLIQLNPKIQDNTGL
ncbi:PH domain-containing protein [Arenibacter sp. F20364]|uniref:PH domain-containing protein n=1 Tax=Arenibacter sp. F20364 TaxID=2926415 RepID=UPI001FF36383|nr:PH domain-containing protein [Arenibacter sp. F20364]MCK0191235.1 PH domain-containing protein [Arenibacter sp. F20364]